MQCINKHFYRTQDANQPAGKQSGSVIFCEECQPADTNALNETHLKTAVKDLHYLIPDCRKELGHTVSYILCSHYVIVKENMSSLIMISTHHVGSLYYYYLFVCCDCHTRVFAAGQ